MKHEDLIKNARALALAAADYLAELEKDQKDRAALGTLKVWRLEASQSALLDLCNAAIDFADDGDFYRLRKIVCEDNNWDHEGRDLDADGFPIVEREF